MNYPTPNLDHLSCDDYQHVYEPAEDTFLFLDTLEIEAKFLKQLRPLISLEIGSGSGCVSTFVANILQSDTFYLCTDINYKATLSTRSTGLANKCNLNPVLTDLVQGLLPRLESSVDLIMFNPPYVVTESSEINSKDVIARSWAGGIKGMEVTDRILPLIPKLLSPQGVFYLVAIEENMPEEIDSLMSTFGFQMEIVLKRRAGREKLMVLKFQRKHSK